MAGKFSSDRISDYIKRSEVVFLVKYYYWNPPSLPPSLPPHTHTHPTECTIDCPTTATTPSDDEGPNTLLIVLIVTIPCALVIVLLACLSTIICFLIFRHRCGRGRF